MVNVRPGLEVLLDDPRPIAGKRIGLVTNHAAVTSDLRHEIIPVDYLAPGAESIQSRLQRLWKLDSASGESFKCFLLWKTRMAISSARGSYLCAASVRDRLYR